MLHDIMGIEVFGITPALVQTMQSCLAADQSQLLPACLPACLPAWDRNAEPVQAQLPQLSLPLHSTQPQNLCKHSCLSSPSHSIPRSPRTCASTVASALPPTPFHAAPEPVQAQLPQLSLPLHSTQPQNLCKHSCLSSPSHSIPRSPMQQVNTGAFLCVCV